ncbi:GNAT family N-acetyltransferase [Enterococcus faecium]|uniref:GNAT family N-acetyltransferase n=1 Tax=Enterococcus faecium TaxID=1352 RepID=UPI00190EA077|nr:GNAT family N-acetyltransferase [Enterococcus faecium]
MTQHSKIEIRKMVPEDYPAVYELWQKDPTVHVNDFDDSFDEINRLLKFNPGFCFVAANSNQQIVGNVLAATDGRQGSINYLAVSPNDQNNDIATRLINLVITEVCQMVLKDSFYPLEISSCGRSFLLFY